MSPARQSARVSVRQSARPPVRMPGRSAIRLPVRSAIRSSVRLTHVNRMRGGVATEQSGCIGNANFVDTDPFSGVFRRLQTYRST